MQPWTGRKNRKKIKSNPEKEEEKNVIKATESTKVNVEKIFFLLILFLNLMI